MKPAKDQPTDGAKANLVRRALLKAVHAHPDTANQPRKVLREMMNLPSISLAQVYDAIKLETEL